MSINYFYMYYVPAEGDLKTYASLSIHYHYRGDDSYGRNMFTKDDRLKSVRSLHKKADDSPMYAASPTEITSEFKVCACIWWIKPIRSCYIIMLCHRTAPELSGPLIMLIPKFDFNPCHYC